MKTAGVVIDFYDDPNGEVLKRVFPTLETLPEVVKEAHILSPEEHGVLRNEAYALILHNEGHMIRKFACVDPGNTYLSTIYFHENADKLPEEAMKVAAANIASFCQEFDIEPTNFIKTAAASHPSPNEGKFEHKRSNINQGFEGGGQTLTDDKKVNGPSKKNPVEQNHTSNASPANVTKKTSDGEGGIEITGENVESTKWPKVANVVDVSGQEPTSYVQKHSSVQTALGDRYPLDSFADVQAAIQYFGENWLEFVPRERHEYAVKTAARAEDLGLEVDELMERYGSTSYAPDVEAHLSARKANCDKEFHELFDMLKEKKSSIDPEKFAELLGEADKVSGLHYYYGNGQIFDPYHATFGGMSEKKAAAAFSWTGRVGDTVTADQLNKLALNGRGIMKKNFSHDIVNAFQKDPVTIFNSLPDDSKTIISRLANGEFDAEPMN